MGVTGSYQDGTRPIKILIISELKWLTENIDKIDWDENGKLAIDGWEY